MTVAARDLIPAADREFIDFRPLPSLAGGAGIMIRMKSPALRASWEPIPQPSWDGWCDDAMGGYIVPDDMREKLRQWLLEIRVER